MDDRTKGQKEQSNNKKLPEQAVLEAIQLQPVSADIWK